MSKAKTESKAGRVSVGELIKSINKKANRNVAHSLMEDNPTDVKDWIPTGSTWLDATICKGKWAGIPIGKIVEIAGLEATGKSYMAAQIAANAQKKNILPVYFDSESALDSEFLIRAGCDLSDLVYVQASSVEFVLETIEHLLDVSDRQLLFIWDSLAFTPSISDVEGSFDPQSTVAAKARILAKGVSKLTIPIADKQATWLVLNQLKTNITRIAAEALTTPYITPGGKAMSYAYSLRIWLTGRKAKAAYITAENGYRIGSEVKAKLEKSRFGSQGRSVTFKILWGTDSVGIQDDESIFEAISTTPVMSGGAGGWYTFKIGDYEKRFRSADWNLLMSEDDEFKAKVMEAVEQEVIQKFSNQEGHASDFYDLDGEEGDSLDE